MKKLFYLFLIIGLAIISCNKPDVLPTEVEVSFQTSMGGTNFKAGGDPISAFDCNTDGATYAILVINDVSYTVDLIRDDDGSVYTQSIKLPVLASGVKYELTSFMLYDDNDILILASPNSNAPFGEFVTAGLPIDFEVDGFYKVNIPIQVLCYTPTTIIEFGFSWFSFETVTVRELCFFGDICVDIDDYVGSIYEGQLYGLQHDMPAIFKVEISMWNGDANNGAGAYEIITTKNNETSEAALETTETSDDFDWLGEGAALCVQYPDYENSDDKYKIELSVWVNDGTGVNGENGFSYVSFETWTFTDAEGFPIVDVDEDGVIDFVIGDCVPNADIIIDPEIEGETAFAYDPTNGLATCFQDGTPSFSRWGWTNGTYSVGTYSLDLWAAAGQCDTNKGSLVGTVGLTVNASGDVNVVYNINSEVTLMEVHVYVGDEKYPLDNNSEPTVAPGGYTFIDDDDSDGIVTNIFLGNYNIDGGIYIIAHATVELPVGDDDD